MEILPEKLHSSSEEYDAKKRLAAYLDSRGDSRVKIAEVVGVTPKTISVWRKEESYLALRKDWENMDLERIQGLVMRYRHMVLDGAQEAWDTLKEALSASDDEDRPQWFVRIRAAETMIKHAEGAAGLNIEGANSGRAMAQAAVIVIARDHPDVIVQGSDTVEDAVFTGVAEDREGDTDEHVWDHEERFGKEGEDA